MTISQHLAEQERLLAMEYEYEKHEFEELSRSIGIQRRIKQGKCWYPIACGETRYDALNQIVIHISNQRDTADQEAIDHEFEPGRPVAFFYTDEDGTSANDTAKPIFLPWQCQISRVQDQRMRIVIPSMKVADVLRQYARDGRLGVQLSFDATSHMVMRGAIHTLQETDDPKILAMRDILIGQKEPSFRTEQPLSFPWLNPSQQKAVMKVVNAREVAIVHGPPGTGKTTTLVEAIGEILKRETQVMVCAQSNAAVDWIAEQLLARGISVLRVGNPLRVSDSLLDATYERQYEAHPDYQDLWAIRRAERETIAKLSSRHAKPNERRTAQVRLNRLRSCRTQLEITINEDLFARNRVIACTLIGSAARVLERRHFSTLFIDEAAQAFEAACWAAILKADRVILAGDHCQLPPTVKCIEAERQGLAKTLMEIVANGKPACVELLTTQYRMHRDIMQFSSDWFYHGQLLAAPEIAQRRIHEFDTPLVWIDTSQLGYEEQSNPLSQSRLNTSEGLLLVKTLRDYVRKLGMERMLADRVDFGIISPYRGQVQLLRKLVRQSNFLKPLQSQISVNTVDGFQGQERDVILISMVRGNDKGRIGFLNDLRRMNVAITRARMKLIVLGDTTTLAHNPFYKKLIEHVAEHGKMVVVEPEKED